MARDAVKRLKLAKRAARAVLSGGGSVDAAATAAQQFGTPADGSDSDGDSDDGSQDGDVPDVEALASAVEGQLALAGSREPCAPASGDG